MGAKVAIRHHLPTRALYIAPVPLMPAKANLCNHQNVIEPEMNIKIDSSSKCLSYSQQTFSYIRVGLHFQVNRVKLATHCGRLSLTEWT